jgi:hypothetical protein
MRIAQHSTELISYLYVEQSGDRLLFAVPSNGGHGGAEKSFGGIVTEVHTDLLMMNQKKS